MPRTKPAPPPAPGPAAAAAPDADDDLDVDADPAATDASADDAAEAPGLLVVDDPHVARLARTLEQLGGDPSVMVRLKRIMPRFDDQGEKLDGLVPSYELDASLAPGELIDRIYRDHGGGHYHVMFMRGGHFVAGGTVPLPLPGKAKRWSPPADAPPPTNGAVAAPSDLDTLARRHLETALGRLGTAPGGDMSGTAGLLQGEVGRLQAEVQSLRDRCDELREERADHKARCATLEGDARAAADRVARAERDLETERKAHERTRDSTERDLKDARRDGDRLRDELAAERAKHGRGGDIGEYLKFHQAMGGATKGTRERLDEAVEGSLLTELPKIVRNLMRTDMSDEPADKLDRWGALLEKGLDTFLRVRDDRLAGRTGARRTTGARGRPGDDAKPAKAHIVGGTAGAPSDTPDRAGLPASKGPALSEAECAAATGLTMLSPARWAEIRGLVDAGASGYAYAEQVYAWDQAEDPRRAGVNPLLVRNSMHQALPTLLAFVDKLGTSEQRHVLLSDRGRAFVGEWHRFWRELAAEGVTAAGGTDDAPEADAGDDDADGGIFA